MFNGFNAKTTEFLWGIRFNNNREWFLENKQLYLENLQRPLNALAADVWTYLNNRHSLDIGFRVARIYRDARRIRSGGPYKEGLWFSLEKEHENWQSIPVFYFEISPEGYSYGMGYYAAPAAVMKHFRSRLDANPAEFEAIAFALQTKKYFEISGDEYKRIKGEKEGILGQWYNRKTIVVSAEFKGHDKLYSPGFVKTLRRDLQDLIPLYNFLWSLEGVSSADP